MQGNGWARLTLLVAPESHDPRLWPAHGVSILVSLGGESILVDTGPSYRVLETNARILGVDLSGIGTVVLTSWSKQSLGGLPAVVAAGAPRILAPPGPAPRIERHGVKVEIVEESIELNEHTRIIGGLSSLGDGKPLLALMLESALGHAVLYGCSCPASWPIEEAYIAIGKYCGADYRIVLPCLYDCAEPWGGRCRLSVGSTIMLPLTPP